jgi:hypothetical protein
MATMSIEKVRTPKMLEFVRKATIGSAVKYMALKYAASLGGGRNNLRSWCSAKACAPLTTVST